jgi:hypothetical protein
MVFLSYGLCKLPLRYLNLNAHRKVNIKLIRFEELEKVYSKSARRVIGLVEVFSLGVQGNQEFLWLHLSK